MSVQPLSAQDVALEVVVLGRFALRVNAREVALPVHAQRLVAYLSIGRRQRIAHPRAGLAEQLWPHTPVTRAQASLRTALWRARRADPRLVHALPDTVQLGSEVDVDLHRSVRQAERLISDETPLHSADARVELLVGDLLPSWEEDWLLLERERVRQLRIHALEALSRQLCALGRHAQAVDAALTAIAAEPLRESAYSALIAAYCAEGNLAAAHRQYQRFSALLWQELHVEPSLSLRLQLKPR